MEQYFYVLFDSKRSVFYQDSQLGITNDIMLAEHYDSYEKAKRELSYFSDNDTWTIKKVTVSID